MSTRREFPYAFSVIFAMIWTNVIAVSLIGWASMMQRFGWKGHGVMLPIVCACVFATLAVCRIFARWIVRYQS